jgi:Fe2+ transport system protein B
MTVQQAFEKIQTALVEKKEILEGCGLTTRIRTFYADKNLNERSEFNAKCILVFGNIDIGTASLEEDDWCNFSLCAEIKTAEVEDAALESALKEWGTEVDSFIEKVKGATAKDAFITETCRAQETEAEEAAAEFTKEIKKVRRKMLLGLGIVIVLMLAVLFLLPMVV